MADTALPGGATSKPSLQGPDVPDEPTLVSLEDDRRNQKEESLFSFGAIADVQYADLDDGWNYNKTYRRYYRAALLKLQRAVDVWIRDETHRSYETHRSCYSGSFTENNERNDVTKGLEAGGIRYNFYALILV